MNQSGRMEKVREALDAAYVKDYWEAALAEVEEWETLLRVLRNEGSEATRFAQRAVAAEADVETVGEDLDACQMLLIKTEAEADRLKAALKFYADPASWEESSEPDPRYFATGIIAVNDDEGAIARAALAPADRNTT